MKLSELHLLAKYNTFDTFANAITEHLGMCSTDAKQVDLIKNSEVKFIQPKKKNIQERKDSFNRRVLKLGDSYPDKLLQEFSDYWTEHGENDRKMRFEKEKSFNIDLRLKRWARNSKTFNPIQNRQKI